MLVLVDGPCPAREIAVTEAGLVIGRGGTADVRLAEDHAVSYEHARIARTGDGSVYLEDAGSTNGTFLNGSRVTSRRPVDSHDVISVGRTRFALKTAVDADLVITRASGDADDRRAQQDAPASSKTERGPSMPGPGADDLDSARLIAASRDDDPSGSSAWWPPESNRPQLLDVGTDPGLAGAADAGQKRNPWSGVASNVRQRSEQFSEGDKHITNQVITFRLGQFDSRGNRVGVVTVELRGPEITGEIADGDRVEIDGKEHGGVLHANAVRNLTTGGTLEPVKKKNRRKLIRIAATLLVLAVLAVLALHFAGKVHIPSGSSGSNGLVNAPSGGGSGAGAPGGSGTPTGGAGGGQ